MGTLQAPELDQCDDMTYIRTKCLNNNNNIALAPTHENGEQNHHVSCFPQFHYLWLRLPYDTLWGLFKRHENNVSPQETVCDCLWIYFQ